MQNDQLSAFNFFLAALAGVLWAIGFFLGLTIGAYFARL